MPGPLDGAVVLDLTHYIAGPFATKLLADYGADVIKIERPGGDPARRVGPYANDEAHPEKSATFFYFNTNKRSVVVDLRHERGREVFARLLDRADIVVENFRPGVLDALGIGWEFIHERRPQAPLVSITNFGQTGPYRDYKGSDLVLYGFGGELHSLGMNDREPVKLYGTAGLVEAGSAGGLAAMAAYMVGAEQGVGQHVDLSIVDAHFGGVDRRNNAVIGFEFSGRKELRPEPGAQGLASGMFPCADGYVELTGNTNRLDRVGDMIGNPEWLDDPKWKRPDVSIIPELVEEFNAYLYGWVIERTRREIWEEARRARVMCGPLFTPQDLFEDRHFRDRGFWREVFHAHMGRFEIPGAPFRLNDSPWELRRPAPLLGEHTAAVLGEAGYTEAEIGRLTELHVVEAI